MPFGWLKDMLDSNRKKRKPMSNKRKKLKVSAKSVAGTMKSNADKKKAAMDAAGDY